MRTNPSMVRSIAAIFGSGVVAAFVHAYSLLQANWLQYGQKLDLTVLPLPTMFYHRYVLLGYMLSVMAALPLVRRGAGVAERPVWVEVYLLALGLATLVWVAGCVLAWQLPYYYPTAPIR